MRLGLAFGDMHLTQVRSLPYPLYKKWMMFYALEPWGFSNQEYLTASLRAEIFNTKVTKPSQLRSPLKFIRDMPKEVLRYLRNEKGRIKDEASIDLTTPEGRRMASERVINLFVEAFGNRVERKAK